MSMISKQQFDELVNNTTRYLTEHGPRLLSYSGRMLVE